MYKYLKPAMILVIFLLILAIPSGLWPYNYYILVRWCVFIVGAFVTVQFFNQNETKTTLLYGAITLAFNPILPFYLAKTTWVVIDLISSIAFLYLVISKENEKLFNKNS